MVAELPSQPRELPSRAATPPNRIRPAETVVHSGKAVDPEAMLRAGLRRFPGSTDLKAKLALTLQMKNGCPAQLRDTVGPAALDVDPKSSMTTSIHDHHILELTVNAAERMIRLRTAYPGRSGPDFADVVFEGVEGYVFRGDALGTILFDIESVDAFTLYREYAAEMHRVYATTSGHDPWAQSESTAEDFLTRGELRGYRVSSSIGLEGAVWARHLVIRTG